MLVSVLAVTLSHCASYSPLVLSLQLSYAFSVNHI